MRDIFKKYEEMNKIKAIEGKSQHEARTKVNERQEKIKKKM